MAKARNLRINRTTCSEVEQGRLNSANDQIGHNSITDSTHDQCSHLESGQNTEHPRRGRAAECVVEDADGKRTRGKTVLADIWNLPQGHRVVVEINKSNQPIGAEVGVLGHYCGTIARNGGLCSLSYTQWDHLKKGNKGNNEKMIVNEVKERFLYRNVLQKWIFKSIGHKWRDHKCTLKGIYYLDDENITELHNNCPEDVVQDQWISLVNFWRSDEGQERSQKSILSHQKAKAKPHHTSGTKSHARVSEELKKALQRSPTRTELYLECHQHTKEANITDQIREINAQQGHTEGNLNDDPVAQVLGNDQYGRVRGIGLSVKPSDLIEPSDLHYCRGLNMSTNEETSALYLIRQVKEKMQTLEKRVIKQGNTINKQRYTIRKLKRKSRSDDDIDTSEDSEESSFEGGLNNEVDEEHEVPDTDDKVSF